MTPTILVVEDEPAIQELVVINLKHAGFLVVRAGSAEEADSAIRAALPDLVILDWMLPGQSGVALAKKIRGDERTREIPIIMLTARVHEEDKVQGLDAGADDYVTKPFHIEEVLARLRALIRRAAGHASSELICGPLRLDTKASKADVNGKPLKLTSHEFRLLGYLMHHAGKVVSRTELVEHLYDQDFDRDSNTIEVFVGRLRKKMGIDLIETVRGMGYRMQAPDA